MATRERGGLEEAQGVGISDVGDNAHVVGENHTCTVHSIPHLFAVFQRALHKLYLAYLLFMVVIHLQIVCSTAICHSIATVCHFSCSIIATHHLHLGT